MNFVNNYIEKVLLRLLIFSNLKAVINHKNSCEMHNLKANFDKFLFITKSFYQDSIDADGNYYFYPMKPKMSDCEMIALSPIGETIGIDSENYLFGKIKFDHKHDFDMAGKAKKLTCQYSTYNSCILYQHLFLCFSMFCNTSKLK